MRLAQGKYPDGLKLVEDDELREFIQLCISHTPDARPDTRKLLKHSFFEGCRGKSGDASRLDPDPPRDLSTLLGARPCCLYRAPRNAGALRGAADMLTCAGASRRR